jgi:hypothetical protein
MPSLAPLLLAALPSEGETQPLLAGVPEDAMLVIALAPLDETRARAAENAWWRLACGEELRPLARRAGEWLEGALDAAFAEQGSVPRRLADPRVWLRSVHGPAAAFLSLQGDRLAGAGLLVQPGEDAGAFDELRETALGWAREDASASTLEHRGVELTVLEDRSPRAGSISRLISFDAAGTRGLVAGEEREFVLELAQGAIDRLLGLDPSPGFAGSAALAEARGAAPAGAAIECFLDVGAFIRFGLAEDARDQAAGDGGSREESREQERFLHELFARTGLIAMRYLHAAAAVGAEQSFDLSLSVHLPAGSLLQRAGTLLGPAPRDLMELAPADALGVSAGSADLPGLWQLVRGAVADFEAEAAARLDAGVAAFEALSGLDLEQDLLAQFAGDFASVSVRIPPGEFPVPPELAGMEAEELFSAGSATLLRVDDGDHVASVIERLLALAQLSEAVESEEYQGYTVHGLEMGPATLARWACTDELLVISNTPTPLRTILARAGGEDLPKLLSDGRYLAVLEQHPEAAMLALSDARLSLETALNALEFLANLGIESGAPRAGFAELVELLPDAAALAKHVDGVLFQAVEVQPERFSVLVGSR